MILSGLTTAAPGSTSVSTYLGPYQSGASTSTEGNVQMAMPVAGTSSNLAVNIGSAPGNGRNWVVTIRKNGSATSHGAARSRSRVRSGRFDSVRPNDRAA
jgi:hypothetical protein